jgi:hypothetical protein
VSCDWRPIPCAAVSDRASSTDESSDGHGESSVQKSNNSYESNHPKNPQGHHQRTLNGHSFCLCPAAHGLPMAPRRPRDGLWAPEGPGRSGERSLVASGGGEVPGMRRAWP